MQPDKDNYLRDWWRELWPFITYDVLWVLVGWWLLRRRGKR